MKRKLLRSARGAGLQRAGELVAVSLIAVLLSSICHAQVEYEPGERWAEMKFNMGLGGPWIESKKHPMMYGEKKHNPWGPHFEPYLGLFSFNSPPFVGVHRYVQETPPEIVYPNGPTQPGASLSLYQSEAPSLWIYGDRYWSRQVMVPIGAFVTLMIGSDGGQAVLYDIAPTKRTTTRSYELFSGYSQVSYQASEKGKHLLFFLVNGLPSNVLVIDAA
jgi:hypothetical protein